MHILDKSFLRNPKSYILQSLLATTAIAIILYVVDTLTHAVIVAALGSSTFIVFAMPHSITAQARRVIGGHVVGLLSGFICYFLFLGGPFGNLTANWNHLQWIAYALSVGLSIFLMAITETEHPPAAGTALGTAVHGWSYELIVIILIATVSLALIRRLLRRYLRDLF